MFASFVVSLRPVEPATIGNSSGKSLHGLFFKLLGQEDPQLFEQTHQGSQARPVTVSPLRGRLKRENNRQAVTPDEVYSVRYTTLSEELFNALSKILLRKYISRGDFEIDRCKFTVQDVVVEPEASHGWGRVSSAEEIWERAATTPDVTLRFSSPTAFKQKEMNLVFPIPRNVFHSYRERWNKFTPFPIDEGFIPWVEEKVAVEAHDLETRMVWFTEYQKHGFVGWVRYTATAADHIRLKQMNALADFALFAGTGHKTTQGMGQTRRLPQRDQPEEQNPPSEDVEKEE